MIFSAKESIFKAFFPLLNVWINCLEFELIWREAAGQFTGSLLTSFR
ncbi:4'-phosphopantetheinyl transferase EntD [Sporomusaceae bacterium BoRhaA]|nr:hypothetical protein [Pelorhabdus rhamnosifermentans]MBU2703320.1 4'-phosphopantetheinyl transferase EntD [Pelorhabdus rhamnosifermentans]